MSACVAGLGFAPPAYKALCAVGVALAGYRLTFVVHDCSHRTLFARRRENEIVGWLAASVLFVSFPVYRRLHWIHHLNYGRPGDPQRADYPALVPGRDAVLRHLLKPLVLANLIEKLGAFFAMQHTGMTAAERRAVRRDAADGTQVRVSAALAILAAQGTIAWVSTAGLTFLTGYLLYALPLATLALFMSRVRSYLEHGWLSPQHDGLLVARTHPSNIFEGNLLAGLHFNYHNEHHRWPQVPSRHLPAVHREVTAGALANHEFSPTYLASLRTLVSACRSRNAR